MIFYDFYGYLSTSVLDKSTSLIWAQCRDSSESILELTCVYDERIESTHVLVVFHKIAKDVLPCHSWAVSHPENGAK